MANLVINGATVMCSFGAAPGVLTVLPMNRTMCSGMAAATIMDHVPMVNIKPFGMCSCPANPTVAAATAAKLGVFTPMPCVPATAAPWAPGSPTVMIGGKPALNSTSTCMCTWGGVITITVPAQATTLVP